MLLLDTGQSWPYVDSDLLIIYKTALDIRLSPLSSLFIVVWEK